MKEIKVLGNGSFGMVYLAEDPSNGKQYIAKVCYVNGKSDKVEQYLLDEPKKLASVR